MAIVESASPDIMLMGNPNGGIEEGIKLENGIDATLFEYNDGVDILYWKDASVNYTMAMSNVTMVPTKYNFAALLRVVNSMR